MKYLSLFSGIGGFELGIQQAYESNYGVRLVKQPVSQDNQSVISEIGVNPVSPTKKYEELFNEMELGGCGQKENNLETTMPLSISESDKRQYPTCIGYSEIDKYAIQVYNKHFNHKNYGDCTLIKTNELPDFDLLVGGFPCQAFSIAGKRRGFDEARGTLFFDIARILADKKPRNFILENVKGLLSHDGGRTFTTIIRILSTMGYFIEWQVLNAKNFGVPQNRERVFIVGHFGGMPERKVFSITGSNSKIINQIIGGSQGKRVYGTDGIAVTQASQAGGQGAKTGLYIKNFKNKDELAVTLSASSYKGYGNDGTAMIEEKTKIRRLTPLECERLMGYPDGWTLEGTQGKISDTQRYKMCGNGVVSNVVAEIVKKLICG